MPSAHLWQYRRSIPSRNVGAVFGSLIRRRTLSPASLPQIQNAVSSSETWHSSLLARGVTFGLCDAIGQLLPRWLGFGSQSKPSMELATRSGRFDKVATLPAWPPPQCCCSWLSILQFSYGGALSLQTR